MPAMSDEIPDLDRILAQMLRRARWRTARMLILIVVLTITAAVLMAIGR